MTPWPQRGLGDIVDQSDGLIQTGPFGSQLHRSDYTEGEGVPLVMPKNMIGGRIDYSSAAKVNREKAAEMRRHACEPLDVLLARRGDIGRCALVRAGDVGVLCGTGSIRVSVHGSELAPEFLFYFFSSDRGREELEARAVGATMANLSAGAVRLVNVPTPPLDTQRKIAAVLSRYDDLIENNRRRINLLEEMVQRIYREWFVDCRYSGHDGSGLGGGRPEVPTAWRERELRELGTITMGQSPPSSAYNTTGDGLPFHQGVGTFGEHFPVLTKYSRLGDRIAEAGDVLLSVRAPVGRINVADRKMILGRGLCGVRGGEAPTLFLLYALNDVFQEEDSMGGGSIFNAVTRKDVERIPILWPGRELADLFAERAGETNTLIASLIEASSALRKSRDLLLPRLISGEIDVQGLDISVDEVAA